MNSRVLGFVGKPLQPLPIAFDPGQHHYTWEPTGQRLTFSVTGVLGASKTKQQKSVFERTKHIWGPRGTHVHWGLEMFLKGASPSQILGGPYDDYLAPLLEYPLWESFEPIALEYRVCDLRRNIGGSLDVLGYDHATERMCLLDLKTLGDNGKPYSTDAQLGGYLSMLIDHHKLTVDECLTMWSSRGEAHLGGRQTPVQCLEAWEDAYAYWKVLNPAL